jgi:flagellar motor switch/type III secretory pathway protein FliN
MGMAVQSAAARNSEVTPEHETASENDGLAMMPLLPLTLTLEIPVVRFTVQDLLSLQIGSIAETACHQTNDIPLRVNGILVGWTEFDVVGDRLAVRITEKA